MRLPPQRKLIDVHVHVDNLDELPLYPACGVTAALVLRNVPRHLRWREEIRSSERFALASLKRALEIHPEYVRTRAALGKVSAEG